MSHYTGRMDLSILFSYSRRHGDEIVHIAQGSYKTTDKQKTEIQVEGRAQCKQQKVCAWRGLQDCGPSPPSMHPLSGPCVTSWGTTAAFPKWRKIPCSPDSSFYLPASHLSVLRAPQIKNAETFSFLCLHSSYKKPQRQRH